MQEGEFRIVVNKKIKEIFKLIHHDGLIGLAEEKIPWLNQLEIDEKFNDKKFRKTKRYLFYRELFDRLYELEKKMEDLFITFHLIFNYKIAVKSKHKKEITKSDYILYHIEFFYINTISIFDRMLHFVNFVYNLGINEKFIKKDIILTHRNVDRNIKNFIKKFDLSLKEIRRIQNRSKHNWKFYDNKMFDYELFEMVAKLEKDTSFKRSILGLALSRYNEYTRDLKKSMEKEIKFLIIKVNEFIKLLFPEIKRQHLKFNKK